MFEMIFRAVVVSFALKNIQQKHTKLKVIKSEMNLKNVFFSKICSMSSRIWSRDTSLISDNCISLYLRVYSPRRVRP